MTQAQALREAAARLAATSPTPRLDAELLMAHALGTTREAMLLRGLGDTVPATFGGLIGRRAADEPIAYITGRRAFWTIDLVVTAAVLIPRADSETLIEAALQHFGTRAPRRILDLGTGPGTLLLAALDQWPGASGLGIDASDNALGYARANAARLGMVGRVDWRLGDWAEGVTERFDLILANPPYIATGDALPEEVRGYEPAAALFAGQDGLDDYRRIAPQLTPLLEPGGAAILEIGAGQADAVTALLTEQGLAVHGRQDLGRHVRALIAV